VTGHYDSAHSTFSIVKGDAPGANDDGSGTARSAWNARGFLSKLKFPRDNYFLDRGGRGAGA